MFFGVVLDGVVGYGVGFLLLDGGGLEVVEEEDIVDGGGG